MYITLKDVDGVTYGLSAASVLRIEETRHRDCNVTAVTFNDGLVAYFTMQVEAIVAKLNGR